MNWPLFDVQVGDSPLLINVPHGGTHIPPHLQPLFTEQALAVPDTDWHVAKLYQFAVVSGATLMAATHSRYVVDLNRDPEGAALYPGADNTELCPSRSFENAPLYRAGESLSSEHIAARRQDYWQPYHAALAAQLTAIKARHGYVLLLDAHSILSVVPRFFEGRLPDLNLGTADGASCHASLQARAKSVLAASAFSHIVNGRFKGGYITRHYGQPSQQVHALQLEIAQSAYMQEGPPWAWEQARAAALMAQLQALIASLIAWRPEQLALAMPAPPHSG